MKRKIYSIVLLAAGLLIGTNVWANLPQRPTPADLKGDGIELPKPGISVEIIVPTRDENAVPTIGEDLNVTSSAKAPRKAAMADLMATIYRDGSKFKDYEYTNEGLSAFQTDMQDGDSIVCHRGISSYLDLERDVILNLNGNYLYASSNWYVVYASAKVKIMNGTIYTYDWYYLDSNGAQSGNSYGIYVNSGDVTLENVNLQANNNDYAYYGVYVAANAKLTWDGGGMYAYYGIYTKGSSTTIKGTTDIYAGWYGIYNGATNQSTTITDNASLYGGKYGFADWGNTGGTATINANATIEGGYGMYTKSSITITDNPTIIGDDNPAWYADGGTLKIYGGTFKAEANSIINVGTMSVYGGYFDCPAKTGSGADMKGILSYTNATLYGGKFNNPNTTDEYCHVAAGYAFDDNGDGTYTVRKKIAQIAGSDVNYFSLQDAINAAVSGDEISLLADATENVTITGKEITFNANSKTLEGNMTAASGAVLNIISTGTIKGSLIQNGGTIKVYTGKFTEDPTAFVQVAENCSVTGPAEGIYTVVQGVAKIEETTYTSFADAIAAANAMTDPTVTLLANARLANGTLNVDKSMTIDLNGHSLSSVNTKTSYLRFGTANTEVTIKNGTITNAATATQFSESLVSLSANNQVTLDNVTINHKAKAAVTLLTETAKLIVNSNCTLNGKEYGVYMGNGILENNATSVKVGVGDKDAKITNNAGATMTLVANGVNTKALTLANQGSLEITDGIYAGTITITDGTIAISGGVFYDAVKATMESYKVADKNWNEIRYKGEKAWDLHSASETIIATIDGLNYYSLEDAIRAIAADKTEKTIILQNNVNISDFTSDNQYNIAANQYVKIDLNGKSILAVNATHTPNANLFNIEAKAQLTIDDSSTKVLSEAGKITYQNNCSAAGLVYTANCNGTLILNNGTFENTTKTGVGTVGYTIEIGKGGVLTINGGLLANQYQYAVRYWADTQTNTQMNVNGGEIKAPRPIWIQLAGSTASQSPYAEFNMKGGKITCTVEGGEAFYVYTYGQSLNNIVINVEKGIIDGRFLIGGGSYNGGNYNEDIDIKGGTFISSNSYKSFKRGAEHRSISGGAFFFGSETTADDYIKFCEYITNGHYAVKMCRDDVKGTEFPNIDGKYILCEGDACEDGSFWAIIDGKGEKNPEAVDKKGQWSNDPDKGVFDNTPDIHTDVIINNGDTVEIMSGVEAEANRVVIEEGSGIIVHDGAKLNVGTGGIEVNGEGTGTTYIVVEAGGTVVANGTVISQNVDEIRVEANANGVGTVLLEPSLDYNNQPMSTVQMYTYARYIPEQDKYIWQHFGIPTLTAPDDITNNRGCKSQFWQWNYEIGDWEQVKYKQKQVNTPFRGYNVKTNYEGTDGVTYTFTGKILGNGDATFDLKPGFNFYANSYLAPINASTLIDEIQDDNVEWTVWMYDGKKDNFDMINELSLLFGEDSEIPALRGFFLKLASGSGSPVGINYESTVWKNAMGKSGAASAPAKKPVANSVNGVKISLSDNNGKGDVMYLAQSDKFDASFNNGFDASKQMSEESANLYAETMAGDLAIVATDNLDGLYLSMNTKGETIYTMTFTHQHGEVFELVDLFNNRTIQMTEGATYTFTADKNANISSRFQVRRAPSVTTDTETINADNKVKGGIYTTLGQYVGGANEWSVLPAGVYVIDGKKVVK